MTITRTAIEQLSREGYTDRELMIERMVQAGCEVTIDKLSGGQYRVRVKHKGRSYNEHTTSSTIVPVETAFQKWQERKS